MVKAELNKTSFEIYNDALEVNSGTINASDTQFPFFGVA